MRLTAQIQALHAANYPDVFKPVPSEGLSSLPIAAAIKESAHTVIVAVLDNRVVGYARAEVQRREETETKYAALQLYVHEFGVDAAVRRRGVGKALLAQLRTTAQSLNVGWIGIDAWARNETARAFYVAEGFATQRQIFWLSADVTRKVPAPVP